MESSNYKLIIVGAGAAGLMAAAYLSTALSSQDSTPWQEPQVLLLEKMPRAARKLNITGKGRCNLTNARHWDEFCIHIHPNPNFLKSAFYNFSSSDCMAFFEQLGLPLTIERGQRVYPKSMRAMDVTDTLVNCVKAHNIVRLLQDSPVEEISYKEGHFFVAAGGKVYSSENLLLTTGGLAYPSTGSSGDGYRFAKELGHTIVQPIPSLTALVPKDYISDNGTLTKFGASLKGLQLKNVSLSLWINGAVVQQEFGDLDFTDGGIEGALGFRVSRKAVASLVQNQKVALSLDLKPSLSEEQIRQRIKRESSGGNNSLRFLLGRLLPKQLIAPFLALNPQLEQMSSSKAVEHLPHCLKNVNFTIVSYVGFNRCVVTNGGVSLKEVSQKSMESKIVKGLYFAGELLDLDGDTGGYNLQIAFSTATLAARSAMKLSE